MLYSPCNDLEKVKQTLKQDLQNGSTKTIWF